MKQKLRNKWRDEIIKINANQDYISQKPPSWNQFDEKSFRSSELILPLGAVIKMGYLINWP